ncbi:trigger factor [Lysinibacter cavernae]|uniref:Trigger factor n=1 Tax=Lysinibacter cavernae TaxID=1640652 RepID=A0A7X5QZS6_9MICO|nr:trigger factor [Lysinibacter cavernae]
MPTTTVEKLNPTRVKLLVAVTGDELQPHIKKAYQTVSEQISIPGFRKGKVPAAIIDQRVGKGAVIEQAVNDSLDEFYRAALDGSDVRPMGRPSADVVEWLDIKDLSGTLTLAFEVEVRPEFDIPKLDGIKLTVDDAEIDADAVQAELDELRSRFGTLVTVDRPAKKGDFVTIDLVAKIEDAEVDSASGISYELGSGELIEGIDEALDSLTADETTTFTSTLLGGDNEGKDAEITVTVTAVKERELPEANDDFAQIASEFDTIDELKKSLEEQVGKQAVFTQGRQARDAFVDLLLEKADIPVSEEIVNDEVHRHLEGENRLEDDEHRAEVTASSEKALRTQLLLDAIAEQENIQATQNELTQYIISSAAQYGMEPGQFIQALEQNNQIPVIVGEVARNKALAVALGKATVTDKSGKPVDLSEFTAVDAGEEGEAAEAEAEKPAKKAPAKKAAPKKAAAKADEATDEAAEKPAKKAPAKKPAAKKAPAKKDADK